MDAKRAIEIFDSPNLIDVVYNGSHIYIQKVHENSGTASIYYLNNPEIKQEVALDNLIER